MVGWHHQLNGHEFDQALGDGEGQGSLACCSPWGRKESDTMKPVLGAKKVGETQKGKTSDLVNSFLQATQSFR